MADFTDSKGNTGLIIPGNAVDSDWLQKEPLLTPDRLRNEVLWGIKLRSEATKAEMPDTLLARFIKNAIALAETESGLTIMPVQHKERYPFDRNEYMAYGYLRLRRRPVSSVETLNIETPSGDVIWTVPNEWIDPGYFFQGQLYLLPLATQSGSNSVSGTAASAFMAIMGNLSYVPGYWSITYSTGYKDGALPPVINTLIGCYAGIEALNKLSATNAKSGSHSMSMEGISQSNSNPGPDLYKTAIEALEAQKLKILGRISAEMGSSIICGTV